MRVKLKITYDGTNYSGWQVQPNAVTVQQMVERAVESVTGEKVRVTGSGRTDAGVHAQGQVAHFDTEKNLPAKSFYKALNAHLPPDIRVSDSEQVSDTFNACTSAKQKTYVYSVYVSQTEQPLLERYFYRIDKEPDLSAMRKAAEAFIGEHDFKCFNASGSGAKTTVRTIYSLEIEKNQNQMTFSVTGNGFLYNMVRILVGTLLEIGQGRLKESAAQEMIDSGKREKGGRTLPAKGLCLRSVVYE